MIENKLKRDMVVGYEKEFWRNHELIGVGVYSRWMVGIIYFIINYYYMKWNTQNLKGENDF